MRSLLLYLALFAVVLTQLPGCASAAQPEPRYYDHQREQWVTTVVEECRSAAIQVGKGLTDEQAPLLKEAYYKCLRDNGVML